MATVKQVKCGGKKDLVLEMVIINYVFIFYLKEKKLLIEA